MLPSVILEEGLHELKAQFRVVHVIVILGAAVCGPFVERKDGQLFRCGASAVVAAAEHVAHER